MSFVWNLKVMIEVCRWETAKRCAEITENAEVVRIGGHYNREDDGAATLRSAAAEIRREFGINEARAEGVDA